MGARCPGRAASGCFPLWPVLLSCLFQNRLCKFQDFALLSADVRKADTPGLEGKLVQGLLGELKGGTHAHRPHPPRTGPGQGRTPLPALSLVKPCPMMKLTYVDKTNAFPKQ